VNKYRKNIEIIKIIIIIIIIIIISILGKKIIYIYIGIQLKL
jgi:hypothetical protein